MKDTFQSYLASMKWYEVWYFPKLLYLFLIYRQFVNQRSEFYIDLSKAIEDKLDIIDWLIRGKSHWARYNKPGLSSYYSKMQGNIGMKGLSGMMTGLVPRSDLMSLRAIDECDSTSEIVAGLNCLAHTVRKQDELQKMVLGSVAILFYVVPLILWLLVMIGNEILPLIEQQMPFEKWGTSGKVLWFVCYSLINYWFVSLPILMCVIFGLFWSFANWRGESRAQFDQSSLIINLPYKFYALYMSSVLLIALADLVRNKKTLSNALGIIGETGSPFIQWHVLQIRKNLGSVGGNNSAAFETGLLSPGMLLRLRNYSERKDFDEGLLDISERGFEHIKVEVKKASSVLSFVSMLLVAVVIVMVYITCVGLVIDANNFGDAMLHVSQ